MSRSRSLVNESKSLLKIWCINKIEKYKDEKSWKVPPARREISAPDVRRDRIAMKNVVYCDESRHDGCAQNKYMTIGSLWMPRDQRDTLSREFRNLCRSNGLRSEVKWHKVSTKYIDAYKQAADFFFAQESLKFRCIVVDQSKYDLEKFHGGDRELGFYKFYYELLIKWIEENNEYLFLLDFQRNKESDRYTVLRRALENKLKGKAWVSDLTVIDSHLTPFAQLVDLLTGAVAASWCGHCQPGYAKKLLIDHISAKRGIPLTVESRGPGICKFNIFNIQLND